jgi:hypothetical protein
MNTLKCAEVVFVVENFIQTLFKPLLRGLTVITLSLGTPKILGHPHLKKKQTKKKTSEHT